MVDRSGVRSMFMMFDAFYDFFIVGGLAYYTYYSLESTPKLEAP